jgi:hypothetical protein
MQRNNTGAARSILYRMYLLFLITKGTAYSKKRKFKTVT